MNRPSLGSKAPPAHSGPPSPPGKRKRPYPLPQRHLRQDVFHEVRRRGAHTPAQARWAKATSFAAKRDKTALVAALAPEPREAPAQQPAIQVGFELLLRVLGYPDGDGAVVDGAVERLHVVAHGLVERRPLGATALVDDARGASRTGHRAPTPHAAGQASTARFGGASRQPGRPSPMAAPWRTAPAASRSFTRLT